MDAQVASRERTPRRARVELEELTMRRRIKKDVVQECFLILPVVTILNKMFGLSKKKVADSMQF